MSVWSVEAVETDLDGFHLGPVDLALAPGGAAAVLGPSGAGKTTFLRTLAGFLPAKRGRIVRDGADVSRWAPEERQLGYVPQGLGLFPHRTVERNVRYPMEIRRCGDIPARTRELLDRFRLAALADRYPIRLSAGEQQRVALARAMAAEPSLIIWDEPWQALDVTARYELGLVFRELREVDRVPIVVVTHDSALAFSLADTFVVLDRGQVRLRCDARVLLEAPSDAFVARFVGFENVLDRSTLESCPNSPLARWLLDRAGPDGIAFASPALSEDSRATGRWDGTVRSVRPTPQGATIDLLVSDLWLTLRLPTAGIGGFPRLGERLRFDLDSAAIHPLGSTAEALERET